MLRSSLPEATYSRGAVRGVVRPGHAAGAAVHAHLGQRGQAGRIQERDPRVGRDRDDGPLVHRDPGQGAVADVAPDRGRGRRRSSQPPRTTSVAPDSQLVGARRRRRAPGPRPAPRRCPGCPRCPPGVATTTSALGTDARSAAPAGRLMQAAHRCRWRAPRGCRRRPGSRACRHDLEPLRGAQGACASPAARGRASAGAGPLASVSSAVVSRLAMTPSAPTRYSMWASVSMARTVAVVGSEATWVRSARS